MKRVLQITSVGHAVPLRNSPGLRQRLTVVACLGALAVANAWGADPKLPAQADDAQQRMGRLLRINGPVTDKVDQRIRRTVDATMREAQRQGKWPVFIIEIAAGRTEFGQAYDLARFLSSSALNGATTVAYVDSPLVGHNVLVALACDELVMSPDAEIGEAGKNETAIEAPMRNAYVEIANRRKTIPADLAVAMLDPAVELVEIATDVSQELVLASRVEELRKDKAVRVVRTVKPAGRAALFTGRQGRELGFVGYLAGQRMEVARLWKLPREALQDDPSLGSEWRPVRFYVKGALGKEDGARLQSLVRSQIKEHAVNFVCLWIDSPGGAPRGSIDLANYLASIDPAQVRTVAYIPREALGDAAFIALACDQIVMHPSAILGGAGEAAIDDKDIAVLRSPLEEICKQKSRPPALGAALVDDKLAVYRCVRTTDGLVEYLSDDELRQRQRGEAKADVWRKDDEITRRGHVLRIDGNQAEELGLSTALVDRFADFKAMYGLERDPQLVEPSWVTTLVDALNTPGVRLLLLFLGAAALYAELQSPGIGAAGIVGALCFLLYFWSAYLGGTAGWLEVLLFLSGILCLLLEIFIFPGTAIFGLFGGLFIVSAVILASQTFVWPRNEYQLSHLRTTLTVIVGAAVATIAAVVAMNRYLPHAPMFNRMLLSPPSGEELTEMARRESLVQWDHLVGMHGRTVTPLLPSGKAEIGDELVDVIADGQFVEKGKEIVVVQARGNRVLVRAVEA